jgi:competence protein ComEC
MIAWLLAAMLRIGGISRVWWFPVIAPLLIVYTLGTGASPSAMRACIMACLFFAASLARREADGPSALAAAAILILALDPWQVLDRGFVLSFCLVGGLLLTAPLVTRFTPAFLKPDPFLIRELIPPWKRALFWTLKGVWATLTLSAAAWLTSLPLSAYFFGRVSLIALPANLIAVPASFLIVLAGCFSLVFGSLSLFLAEVFNYANLAIITVLINALDLLASVPYASINVPRPPLWILPVWYAGLVLVALRLRNRPESD